MVGKAMVYEDPNGAYFKYSGSSHVCAWNSKSTKDKFPDSMIPVERGNRKMSESEFIAFCKSMIIKPVVVPSERQWQLESFIRWASNASIAVHETGDKLIVIPLNDEQMDEYRLALKRVTQEGWARNL